MTWIKRPRFSVVVFSKSHEQLQWGSGEQLNKLLIYDWEEMVKQLAMVAITLPHYITQSLLNAQVISKGCMTYYWVIAVCQIYMNFIIN